MSRRDPTTPVRAAERNCEVLGLWRRWSSRQRRQREQRRASRGQRLARMRSRSRSRSAATPRVRFETAEPWCAGATAQTVSLATERPRVPTYPSLSLGSPTRGASRSNRTTPPVRFELAEAWFAGAGTARAILAMAIVPLAFCRATMAPHALAAADRVSRSPDVWTRNSRRLELETAPKSWAILGVGRER